MRQIVKWMKKGNPTKLTAKGTGGKQGCLARAEHVEVLCKLTAGWMNMYPREQGWAQMKED